MVMRRQCMFREQRVDTVELKEVLSLVVRGERLSAAQNHLIGLTSLIQLELEQFHEVSQDPEVRPRQALH